MSKPKYYKVAGVDKWVKSAHFSTRYIIKENKELERWDVVPVELPTVEQVRLILKNPYTTKQKALTSKNIKGTVNPDAVKLIDWACRRGLDISPAVADLSAEAAQYAQLKFNETSDKSVAFMKGLETYSYCSTKCYLCHVSKGEVVSNPREIPNLTYPTREKAIEALTRRITNKALKGGAFKQDKARTRAENTLKWLLEQDDGDKING